jgi:5-methylcytosine-specific restriction endonuclease McrA
MVPRRRHFNAHVKRAVAARAGWRCASCNELLDETYEIDHVVPLACGGADSVDNMVARHAACHKKKTLQEEMERLERARAVAQSRARAPLECTRCGHWVSPYFVHRCTVAPAAASQKKNWSDP